MMANEDLNVHRHLLVDKEQELVLNFLLIAIRKYINNCSIFGASSLTFVPYYDNCVPRQDNELLGPVRVHFTIAD